MTPSTVYTMILYTHPGVYDGPGEGGAEYAGHGAHSVGNPHQDGRVLGRHVQVVHPEPDTASRCQTRL